MLVSNPGMIVYATTRVKMVGSDFVANSTKAASASIAMNIDMYAVLLIRSLPL